MRSLRISVRALRENAAALQALCHPAQAAFVVKSNAYGHGLIETAHSLKGIGDRLCVFTLDEALALREAGVAGAILILGPLEPDRFAEALRADAELTLWDTGAYLADLAAAARTAGSPVKVHVKIDTGVARFGLPFSGAAAAVQQYLQMPELEIAGISSHLAAAEELDSDFTIVQLQRFNDAFAQMQPALEQHGVRPLRHIAASAASMLYPQTRLDRVRIGIALYGLWPSPQTRTAMAASSLVLQPALRFESSLVAIRDVEEGTPIGYGCEYRAPRSMRIGIVPVGYADGIPRMLSNRGAFLVAGQRRPIIGRVCMNTTFVDLGESGVLPGAPVTLIGTDGASAVTADDWAEWAQTINYEIVVRLPSELPRLYE